MMFKNQYKDLFFQLASDYIELREKLAELEKRQEKLEVKVAFLEKELEDRR